MTIRTFQGKKPKLADNVFVDSSAVVLGDVTIGKNSSIWPTTVIRGDIHTITIGEDTNIQDGSVLHVTHDSEYDPGGFPLSIGNQVTIGHKVILHACTIGDLCLIGMGAIVLDGVVIPAEVMLGAGTLVGPGKQLESGYLYLGQPAKKIRSLTDKEKQFLRYSAKNYVLLAEKHRKSE